MNKKEFFFKAMLAEEYKRVAWVFSAFSILKEDVDSWKEDPYPYRIVQTPSKFFFVDPDNRDGQGNSQLTVIEDSEPNTPLFGLQEEISVSQTETQLNLGVDRLVTTYGLLLLNYTVIYYPFKTKVTYINKEFRPKTVEKLIVDRFKDNPENDADRNDQDIYVDEYLKYCDAAFQMTAFSQIAVPGVTIKAIVGAPGIVEYRNKLLEENKGRLEDPAVIAGIDAKLVQYDKDYLANDDSMDFLIKDKSFKIVRKRLFGMHGAEAGFNEDGKIELIDNSLDEGWNPLKFPAINNNSRVGSYNRGFQTQLGGEAVKWLLRASVNINITENDCGTKLGIPKIVLNDNLDWFVGHSIVHNNKLVFISSEDDIKPYIGKEVIVRSPMFCKLPKTDYCQVCAGKKLSANPEAASMAVSDYGSAFLGLFMAAMHGKELAVAKMNWRELIF